MNIKTFFISCCVIMLCNSCQSNQVILPQRTYDFKLLNQYAKVQFLFNEQDELNAINSISLPSWDGCEGEFKRGAFSNCTVERMEDFINQNVSIPQVALDSGVEGKIAYEFIIDEDGGVSQGEITKDLGIGLALEIEKTMNLILDLEPAQINTTDKVPVRVQLEVFCDLVFR